MFSDARVSFLGGAMNLVSMDAQNNAKLTKATHRILL